MERSSQTPPENKIGTNGSELPGKTKALIVNGEKKGTLLLYQSKLQNLEEKFLYSSKTIIFISGLIAAGVAVLLSLFIARKISNPLKILMRGIKQIASGEKVADSKYFRQMMNFTSLV